eukprot:m.115905 g.115905  ORF g.115905 m.115905 type:complete len:182 (+) comp37571_c0_seq12:1676-2221(+)
MGERVDDIKAYIDSCVDAAVESKLTKDASAPKPSGSDRKQLLLNYAGVERAKRAGAATPPQVVKPAFKKASSAKGDCVNLKIGPMIFSIVKQKGVRATHSCGSCRMIAVQKSSSYEEVVEAAKMEFFEGLDINYDYYLANAEGHRISNNLPGGQWTVKEFLDRNGLYPSKLTLYCVRKVWN